MSQVHRFGLMTSASTTELASPFVDLDGPWGDDQVIHATMVDRGQDVMVYETRVPSTWEYLAGGLPDVQVPIDFELSRIPVEERAAQQAEVLVAYLGRSDVSAGSFEDSDEVCFVYWSEDGVVVNADPYALESATGRAICSALENAGIAYDTAVLERYFKGGPGKD